MSTTSTPTRGFNRDCPSSVFVDHTDVCHCPSCWNLDANAPHATKCADFRAVFTVKYVDDDGGYLHALEEGFLTHSAAMTAAETLGVTVYPHR